MISRLFCLIIELLGGDSVASSELQMQAVIQNLKDAGCGEELIASFIRLTQQKQKAKSLVLLEEHRRTLLNNCHIEQKKIESLDDLIHKMRQKK